MKSAAPVVLMLFLFPGVSEFVLGVTLEQARDKFDRHTAGCNSQFTYDPDRPRELGKFEQKERELREQVLLELEARRSKLYDQRRRLERSQLIQQMQGRSLSRSIGNLRGLSFVGGD